MLQTFGRECSALALPGFMTFVNIHCDSGPQSGDKRGSTASNVATPLRLV
jgi:hypothetical protein